MSDASSLQSRTGDEVNHIGASPVNRVSTATSNSGQGSYPGYSQNEPFYKSILSGLSRNLGWGRKRNQMHLTDGDKSSARIGRTSSGSFGTAERIATTGKKPQRENSTCSSKDEGIHSTGEKEEDDLNEYEIKSAVTETNQAEIKSPVEELDEGTGSLSGESDKTQPSENNVNAEEHRSLSHGEDPNLVAFTEDRETESRSSHGYEGDGEDSLQNSLFQGIHALYIEEDGNLDNTASADIFPSYQNNSQSELTPTVPKCNQVAEESFDETPTRTPEIILDIEESGQKTEDSESNSAPKTGASDQSTGPVPEIPAIAKLPGIKSTKKKRIPVKEDRTPKSSKSVLRNPVPLSQKRDKPRLQPALTSSSEMQKNGNVRQRLLQRRPLKKVPQNRQLPPRRLRNNPRVKKEHENGSALNKSGVIISTDDEFIRSGDKQTHKPVIMNPLMDHSLERPVAPHKKINSLLKEGEKPGDAQGGRKSRKNSQSEVWVPGDDKLYVYTYSSAPRLLHIRRIGTKGVSTAGVHETDPNSSFKLRKRNGRVIRGSNYSKDPMPKWDPYFAYARSLSRAELPLYTAEEAKLRREEFRKKLEERSKLRRENLGVSSLYPSKGTVVVHGPSVRKASPSYSVSRNLKKTTKANGRIYSNGASPINTSQRYPRRTKASVSVFTQVFEDELQPMENAEDATVMALVSNILRESALEVAIESEADRVRMAKSAARRFQALEEDSLKEAQSGNSSSRVEEDARKDPEGEETQPNPPAEIEVNS